MKVGHKWIWIVVIGLVGMICTVKPSVLQAQITGGMLDPTTTDPPGEPFSYFAHPTDVIGAMNAPVAPEITPEGYLYTGFGELMFFVGNPLKPVNQRIKTLYKGYLPVVQYKVQSHGVSYNFSMFAADLGGALQGLPVNFIEVQLRNEGPEQRAAFVSTAYRFSGPIDVLGSLPNYRFEQRFDLIPKQYTEGQTIFNRSWKYSFASNGLMRDGRILYLFPTMPEPDERSLSLRDNGLRKYRFLSGEIEGGSDATQSYDPHTPLGVVVYRVLLQPGESKSLVFKMPIAPVPQDSAAAKQVDEADYGQTFQRTVSFWDNLVATSPALTFPEKKVQDALLANTVFDLLAIDKVGSDYIPNVNKFQYHHFYGGSDTDHMLVGLDYARLSEIAGKAAKYSMKTQSPAGLYISYDERPGPVRYWEMFGNTLWNWGRHYQLTYDQSFLRTVYPSVERAVAWEMHITRQDPLGLMPPVAIADDAGLANVHQTGQDIWTLVGLRNAIALAKAIGNDHDAERFQAEYDHFRMAFDKQLAIQIAKTGGYIPPALDRTIKGNNWDNLLTLYPELLFEPFDPRVTATIKESRKTYFEGILGYVLPMAIAKTGDDYVFDTRYRLHYWHSLDNAENGLVRDDPEDQELAVGDLYFFLLHTTSTHAPQEFGAYPWSDRDIVEEDILPDGVASGVLVELMRNMLVREYKNDLFLFSAVSPDWLQPGKKIQVDREPTTFGPVSAELSATSDGWDLTLSNNFRQAPEHIMIPVPWFYDLKQAQADGHDIEVTNGNLILPPETREVKVTGMIKPGTEAISFDRTVDRYKQEYKERYEEFLRTGRTNP